MSSSLSKREVNRQRWSDRIEHWKRSKRPGIYRIDPTYSGHPFLNSAAIDPAEPAPI